MELGSPKVWNKLFNLPLEWVTYTYVKQFEGPELTLFSTLMILMSWTTFEAHVLYPEISTSVTAALHGHNRNGNADDCASKKEHFMHNKLRLSSQCQLCMQVCVCSNTNTSHFHSGKQERGRVHVLFSSYLLIDWIEFAFFFLRTHFTAFVFIFV